MKKVMPWTNFLPHVAATNFAWRRDRITELVEQSAQRSGHAAHYLAEAYLEGCILEEAAKAHWTIREIEHAQRAALADCAGNPTWLI